MSSLPPGHKPPWWAKQQRVQPPADVPQVPESPQFVTEPQSLGRIDYHPHLKVWRAIWFAGRRDVPLGDFATREEADKALQARAALSRNIRQRRTEGVAQHNGGAELARLTAIAASEDGKAQHEEVLFSEAAAILHRNVQRMHAAQIAGNHHAVIEHATVASRAIETYAKTIEAATVHVAVVQEVVDTLAALAR